MNNIFCNIKNFFEDFILQVKNTFLSSKYILRGKCKKCGACCRNILFSTSDGYVKSEEVFNKMRKKHRYYRNFKISGVVSDKKDFQNGALTFECKFITKNNKCLIYPFRPLFCRDYPSINQEMIYQGVTMLDNCGFYFEVNKKFKDYLN